MILTEPTVLTPSLVAGVQKWVVDTGNRGEAFAWRHHLSQAGLDPDQGRMAQAMTIRTVSTRWILDFDFADRPADTKE